MSIKGALRSKAWLIIIVVLLAIYFEIKEIHLLIRELNKNETKEIENEILGFDYYVDSTRKHSLDADNSNSGSI